MYFRIYPLPGTNTLSEIYIEEVCTRAKFKLDRPLSCPNGALLRLTDGQWFLARNGEETMIEGRWALISAP